jgi:hypothetical protein
LTRGKRLTSSTRVPNGGTSTGDDGIPPAGDGGIPALPDAPIVPIPEPPLHYFSINLSEAFPTRFSAGPAGLYKTETKTFGPYADNRWIYSHSADRPVIYNDLVLDGAAYEPNGVPNYINNGATTLLRVLPAGQTFTLAVQYNAAYNSGFHGAQGLLRAYNKTI